MKTHTVGEPSEGAAMAEKASVEMNLDELGWGVVAQRQVDTDRQASPNGSEGRPMGLAWKRSDRVERWAVRAKQAKRYSYCYLKYISL